MPHSLFSTDTDLTAENLLRLPAEFGCPVWVYDAQIIRRQIAALKQFDVVRFAQKACSNIHILRLMREQGVKVDSVSLGKRTLMILFLRQMLSIRRRLNASVNCKFR